VEEWKRDLKSKSVEAANESIVADGTDEAYEAFAVLMIGIGFGGGAMAAGQGTGVDTEAILT
jgi:hypothetical protein